MKAVTIVTKEQTFKEDMRWTPFAAHEPIEGLREAPGVITQQELREIQDLEDALTQFCFSVGIEESEENTAMQARIDALKDSVIEKLESGCFVEMGLMCVAPTNGDDPRTGLSRIAIVSLFRPHTN